MQLTIALVGDYDQTVIAHQAIPLAIKLSAQKLSLAIKPLWLSTVDVDKTNLQEFDGIWCVPASPYLNMQGALSAIQFARESGLPFLGTCGGYQHAALEFVRNVLGFEMADNAEVNPAASMPLISGLRCKLVEKSDPVHIVKGSRLAEIYAAPLADEDYHCSFGINPDYLNLFEKSAMTLSAFDNDGEPKALEIASHPFFIGTAFQPERKSLNGEIHPLVLAFVRAVESAYRTKMQK